MGVFSCFFFPFKDSADFWLLASLLFSFSLLLAFFASPLCFSPLACCFAFLFLRVFLLFCFFASLLFGFSVALPLFSARKSRKPHSNPKRILNQPE
jgi:hypothetical protein